MNRNDIIDRIKRFLKKGEDLQTEYKEARNQLPGETFNTICAFLNRDGGDLFLGVDNSGNILGIDEGSIDKLKRDLVNQSNNTNKLNPPFILFPKIVEIKGKTIIHIQVPQSSQVHKTRGIVFDRSEDGDYRVTDPALSLDCCGRSEQAQPHHMRCSGRERDTYYVRMSRALCWIGFLFLLVTILATKCREPWGFAV